ncbi:hypothetical protein G6F56_004735 [Rhizopus delemar]|nr:hypothetical protein G6F56_004735 [Rhizopus delemar]
MEGVSALRELIEPNDYLCKIDLKDAYIVVPIHPEYLSFKHQDTIYQYQSLAFGLSVAPWVFSKLMRLALGPIRAKGIRLVYYLDDICVLAKSKEEMKTCCNEDLKQLISLRSIINYQKSDLIPKRIQKSLGFFFNTKTLKISVPQKKLIKLMSKIRQINQTSRIRSCRWFAGLLGKITAMIPAMGEALLHIRYLQRDLAKSLRIQQYDWEMPYHLSSKAWKELKWWEINAENLNGPPIPKMGDTRPSAVVIHVDTSDSGWGIMSNGFWTEIEKEILINVRELQTILFAL